MSREVDLGGELRAWRELRDVSLRTLGKILNCDHSRVWKIEAGRLPMTREVADLCDKALDTGGALVAALAAAQTLIRPAQLPAGPARLVGRDAELAALAAGVRDRPPGTPGVVAIDGPAGVGKTALALRWAHEVAHQYVDGQLYANLRGFAPAEHREQVTVHAVLEEFLVALGAGSVPKTTEQRAALFRSLVADRRVLIVLDNVEGLYVIWPLLPASAGCGVVVTSRRALSGLVGEVGATRVTVRPLAEPDAITLVSQTIGEPRADAEAAAVTTLTRLFGHLPMALHAAAERIAMYPHRQVAGLVDELAEDEHRLGVGEITDLATVFSWSYRDLDPDAARLFRLLGLHHGEFLSVAAVAALAGVTVPLARRLLHRLAAIHLIDIDSVGVVRLHDLIRAYARELVATEDSDDQRSAAAQRLVTWYVHTAHSTSRAASRAAATVPTPLDESLPLVDGVRPLDFADRDTALAWRDAEQTNFGPVTTLALDYGPAGAAHHLATGLESVGLLDRTDTDAQQRDTAPRVAPGACHAEDRPRTREPTEESPEESAQEPPPVVNPFAAALATMHELHERQGPRDDHFGHHGDHVGGEWTGGPPWARCQWRGAGDGPGDRGWGTSGFLELIEKALWTTPVILEAVGSGKDLRHGSGGEVPG